MKKEKFSVLMSVYIKEKPEYLDKALESVFTQTLMPDDVVLVEDGPVTEELEEVIGKYSKKYKQLNVVRYEKNRGLGIALHDGLLECKHNIVFRMDTDDICLPNRFEKQMEVFINDKDIDIVGSNITEFDETMENKTSERIVPETDSEIKKMAKKRNPMNHMTVAYKKDAVIKAGNYQDMMYFEDYYLWVRMMINNCKFYNVQEVLGHVRGGNDMIKRRGGKKYFKPIMNFENKLLELKFISKFEYIKNVTQRIGGAMIPNGLRFFLYKKILRK